MLIEGYATRPAISAAEQRLRFANAMSRRSPEGGAWSHPRLPADLTANLRDAARMARLRFRTNVYDLFDGWLERPKIVLVIRVVRFAEIVVSLYHPHRSVDIAVRGYADCHHDVTSLERGPEAVVELSDLGGLGLCFFC